MRVREVVAVLIVLWLVGAGNVLGQSLGDVARQQKTNQNAPTAKKVITDDDLPRTETISNNDSKDNKDKKTATSDGKDSDVKPESTVDKLETAAAFRAAIRDQKSVVDKMQQDLNDLKGSIHFVEANRYTNGVEYNEVQIRRQNEANRLQKRLDEEKTHLEDLQEAARKAGFGSALYE